MITTYRTGAYENDGTSNHIWETRTPEGDLVAELYVSTDRLEIMNVWVAPAARGEGHARHLYETASEQMDVYHAPVAHRTPEGDAFAEAVGGDTVDPYPCDCHACDNPED
ncbi:hypothetical protein OG211_12520 [Streptomyces niveus]|uniref:hypothetical protein n=1 Tax=Streptomyces niveus TaxID=193462 RepID=UPI00386DB6B2|nr:hypothetical protein OG211_12520 [Streptomyces niveus]